MSSSWGNSVRISIFGGSHTGAIGVNIEGLPAGESVDWPEVLAQMARRAPGQDKTATTRKESDEPRVLCGLLDGVTTGAPLCAVIENNNQRSKDYSQLKVLPRPGHADYTAEVKYGGHQDVRGGGHFSGRLTAPLVFAGAVARQILRRRGIMIGSHVLKVAGAELGDRPFDPVGVSPELLDRLSGEYFPVIDPAARESMRRSIEEARLSLDSVGGVVECAVLGMPVGAGDPIFDGVENRIASIVFGIPGGVRRGLWRCGYARQREQRPLVYVRGRLHKDPHKQLRRDFRRHLKRYAHNIPCGPKAHPLYKPGAGHGQPDGKVRREAHHNRPPRPLRGPQGRSGGGGRRCRGRLRPFGPEPYAIGRNMS